MICFHRCARDWPVWAKEFEQALLDIGFALVLFQILGKPTHIMTVARLGIYNSDSSRLGFTPQRDQPNMSRLNHKRGLQGLNLGFTMAFMCWFWLVWVRRG